MDFGGLNPGGAVEISGVDYGERRTTVNEGGEPRGLEAAIYILICLNSDKKGIRPLLPPKESRHRYQIHREKKIER